MIIVPRFYHNKKHTLSRTVTTAFVFHRNKGIRYRKDYLKEPFQLLVSARLLLTACSLGFVKLKFIE